MGSIHGSGPSSAPDQPEPSSSYINWRLEDYNLQAYTYAWHTQQAVEDIMEIMSQFGGDPKLSAAYKQLMADYTKVGTGDPPTKQECEDFIQDVKKFEALAKNEGVDSERFNDDINTINQSLPKFENWVDAGEPKG